MVLQDTWLFGGTVAQELLKRQGAYAALYYSQFA